MSTNFIPADINTQYFLPPSMQGWLPEEHLARFIVDIVAQLELRSIVHQYGGRGSRAYHPRMLLALLFYGCATGVFSSRKLEKATYDSVAFRFIAANTHPDHDTIASFRKRFLNELQELFVQILLIAKEMGLLKLGKVSLDGTKVKANVSKHHALSWGHTCKIEKQLQAEVTELMRLAEEADSREIAAKMDVPEELKRRQDRLDAIAEAKKKIEERSDERYSSEVKEYEEKVAKREGKAKKSGNTPRGPKPKPPTPGPRDKDQVNLTDEESKIMPSSKGFEQAYMAQAAVDLDTMCIVSTHITQAPNDKQEIVPTIQALEKLPEELGQVDTLLADTGYFSEANVNECVDAELAPLIPGGCQKHNQPLEEKFSEPEPLADDASSVEKMEYQLKTLEHSRTCFRNHQTCYGISAIPPSWP